MEIKRPLADEIRPERLEDFFGQEHILGQGAILRKIIDSGKIPNMIFYGPSGTGKTTLANIIANRTNRRLRKLNATNAGLADIKEIIAELDSLLAPNGILLYLDEIQYFNKKQQQSLLEFIEDGRISLIASTTENPYFYIYNALLSRSSVFEFKELGLEDIKKGLLRTKSYLEERDSLKIDFDEGALELLSQSSAGDLRRAITALELIYNSSDINDGVILIDRESARNLTSKSAFRHDRDSDEHFDSLSALMKSIRGSDPDAALHYLARLLEAGDLIGASRRILCSASEDIGLAHPEAVSIVKACVDSAFQLGLPEAKLPLAEAVVYLATAPKSNSAYLGINKAMSDVKAGKAGPIPRELQNVHADGTGFEREQGYLYPHDFKNRWVKQDYMPENLRGIKYYEPAENKREQAIAAYWKKLKGE
jgi:putative ATPase